MKIVYLSESNIPSRAANSFHVMSMADGLSKNGDIVTLIAPDYNKSKNTIKEIKNYYGTDGNFKIKFFSINKYLRGLFFTFKTIKYLSKHNVDLIISRSLIPSTILSLIKYSVILEIHSPPKSLKHKLSLFIISKLNNLISLVVITNNLKRNLCEKKYLRLIENKIKVFPDAVDIEKFSEYHNKYSTIRKKFNLKDDDFCVGYVGQLYDGRGIQLIISLAKTIPSIKFVIVGGENDKVKELRDKCKKNNINNIKLLGFQDHSILPEIYSIFNVILMPYQNDTTDLGGNITTLWMSPMKMFEYMASKKPIISSDLHAIREILSDEECLFCNSNKPEDWERKIILLKKDATLRQRLVENSFSKVKNYTWNKRAKSLKNLYVE